MATATELAVQNGHTVYRKSVKSPIAGVLKPGNQNKKLGYKITKGRWKGKYLYSLTLEERSTCPITCHHWKDCYGNNMPFAHRFQNGPNLLVAIASDVDRLSSKHPNGIVVRLHVLGDFYSTEYVMFWRSLLEKYPTLSVFGYTARIGCAVGRSLIHLNQEFGDRCVIRQSQNRETDSLGTLYAAEESFNGQHFVCPEQTDKVDNCASCGLCWSSNRTVKFLSH